jgi:hypothetical protein
MSSQRAGAGAACQGAALRESWRRGTGVRSRAWPAAIGKMD